MTRPKLPKTIAREQWKNRPRELDCLTGICALCKLMVHKGDRVMYYPMESKIECMKCLEAE